MKQKLTTKEQMFVAAFLGPARGNATNAAVAAGYGRNRKTAATLGNRLLQKVEIQRAISTRVAAVERQNILSADERDEMLSAIARRLAHGHDVAGAIRAIAELNKCTGRHSMKHLHEGTLTLEQVLGESRK